MSAARQLPRPSCRLAVFLDLASMALGSTRQQLLCNQTQPALVLRGWPGGITQQCASQTLPQHWCCLRQVAQAPAEGGTCSRKPATLPGPALAMLAEMSVTAGCPGAFENAKVMLTPSLSKTTRCRRAGDGAARELLGPDRPAGSLAGQEPTSSRGIQISQAGLPRSTGSAEHAQACAARAAGSSGQPAQGSGPWLRGMQSQRGLLQHGVRAAAMAWGLHLQRGQPRSASAGAAAPGSRQSCAQHSCQRRHPAGLPADPAAHQAASLSARRQSTKQLWIPDLHDTATQAPSLALCRVEPQRDEPLAQRRQPCLFLGSCMLR